MRYRGGIIGVFLDIRYRARTGDGCLCGKRKKSDCKEIQMLEEGGGHKIKLG